MKQINARLFCTCYTYKDLYEDYVLEKTGKVQKHISFPPMFRVEVEGKTLQVGTPYGVQLPEGTSDFPAHPRYSLSVGESVQSGLWSIVLLAVWKVILLLLSYLFFLRYDVR